MMQEIEQFVQNWAVQKKIASSTILKPNLYFLKKKRKFFYEWCKRTSNLYKIEPFKKANFFNNFEAGFILFERKSKLFYEQENEQFVQNWATQKKATGSVFNNFEARFIFCEKNVSFLRMMQESILIKQIQRP